MRLKITGFKGKVCHCMSVLMLQANDRKFWASLFSFHLHKTTKKNDNKNNNNMLQGWVDPISAHLFVIVSWRKYCSMVLWWGKLPCFTSITLYRVLTLPGIFCLFLNTNKHHPRTANTASSQTTLVKCTTLQTTPWQFYNAPLIVNMWHTAGTSRLTNQCRYIDSEVVSSFWWSQCADGGRSMTGWKSMG